MLFNSLEFGFFLVFVFVFYWLILQRNLKTQNIFIVLVSYIFYGWWNWKFLTLIIFSTVIDYTIGRLLKTEENQKRRRIMLWTSILINLGFLGFFKYYNFFIESFITAFSFTGYQLNISSLSIILPVGISFYTFQTLSYTIDIYNKKIEPTNDFIAFSAFVCFFPQLVAGPIERSVNLLPQFFKKRKFEYHKAVDGSRQILWGLFKKIVIADNCAEYANQIFNHSNDFNGSTLVLGAFYFAFQIYGDFSGYSDIAIGTSRLFGFNLNQNFAFPYFSRDVAEFWRRWHISLSTWFRDYLYIPLGGSRRSTLRNVLNVFIVFTVSGFWHGANWTFIAWGFVNALLFLPLLLRNKNRNNTDLVASGKNLPSGKELLLMLSTFSLCSLAWIFFRAANLTHAMNYISKIFSLSLFELPKFLGMTKGVTTIILVILFIIIEWIGREGKYALENVFLNKSSVFRYASYFIILVMIFWFSGGKQQFIYFQF